MKILNTPVQVPTVVAESESNTESENNAESENSTEADADTSSGESESAESDIFFKIYKPKSHCRRQSGNLVMSLKTE